MKKLLSILATLAVAGSAATGVVACSVNPYQQQDQNPDFNNGSNPDSNNNGKTNGKSDGSMSDGINGIPDNSGSNGSSKDNSPAVDPTQKAINAKTEKANLEDNAQLFGRKAILQDQFGIDGDYLDNQLFNGYDPSDGLKTSMSGLNTKGTYGSKADQFPLISFLHNSGVLNDSIYNLINGTILPMLDGVDSPSPTDLGSMINGALPLLSLLQGTIKGAIGDPSAIENKADSFLIPALRKILLALTSKDNKLDSKYDALTVGDSLKAIMIGAAHTLGALYGDESGASAYADMTNVSDENVNNAISYLVKMLEKILDPSGDATLDLNSFGSQVDVDDATDCIKLLAMYIEQFDDYKLQNGQIPDSNHIWNNPTQVRVPYIISGVPQVGNDSSESYGPYMIHGGPEKNNPLLGTKEAVDIVRSKQINVSKFDFNILKFIKNISYYLGKLDNAQGKFRLQELFAMFFVDDSDRSSVNNIMLNWDNKIDGVDGLTTANAKEGTEMAPMMKLINEFLSQYLTDNQPDAYAQIIQKMKDVSILGIHPLTDLANSISWPMIVDAIRHNVYMLIQSITWDKGFALSEEKLAGLVPMTTLDNGLDSMGVLGKGLKILVNFSGLRVMPQWAQLENKGFLDYLFEGNVYELLSEAGSTDGMVNFYKSLDGLIAAKDQAVSIKGEDTNSFKLTVTAGKTGNPDVTIKSDDGSTLDATAKEIGTEITVTIKDDLSKGDKNGTYNVKFGGIKGKAQLKIDVEPDPAKNTKSLIYSNVPSSKTLKIESNDLVLSDEGAYNSDIESQMVAIEPTISPTTSETIINAINGILVKMKPYVSQVPEGETINLQNSLGTYKDIKFTSNGLVSELNTDLNKSKQNNPGWSNGDGGYEKPYISKVVAATSDTKSKSTEVYVWANNIYEGYYNTWSHTTIDDFGKTLNINGVNINASSISSSTVSGNDGYLKNVVYKGTISGPASDDMAVSGNALGAYYTNKTDWFGNVIGKSWKYETKTISNSAMNIAWKTDQLKLAGLLNLDFENDNWVDKKSLTLNKEQLDSLPGLFITSNGQSIEGQVDVKSGPSLNLQSVAAWSLSSLLGVVGLAPFSAQKSPLGLPVADDNTIGKLILKLGDLLDADGSIDLDSFQSDLNPENFHHLIYAIFGKNDNDKNIVDKVLDALTGNSSDMMSGLKSALGITDDPTSYDKNGLLGALMYAFTPSLVGGQNGGDKGRTISADKNAKSPLWDYLLSSDPNNKGLLFRAWAMVNDKDNQTQLNKMNLDTNYTFSNWEESGLQNDGKFTTAVVYINYRYSWTAYNEDGTVTTKYAGGSKDGVNYKLTINNANTSSPSYTIEKA